MTIDKGDEKLSTPADVGHPWFTKLWPLCLAWFIIGAMAGATVMWLVDRGCRISHDQGLRGAGCRGNVTPPRPRQAEGKALKHLTPRPNPSPRKTHNQAGINQGDFASRIHSSA